MNIIKNKYKEVYCGIKITLFIIFYNLLQVIFFPIIDLSPNYNIFFVLSNVISILSLIILFVFVRIIEKRNPSNYGIIISKKSLKNFFIGFILGGLSIIVIALILFATNNVELSLDIYHPILNINIIYSLVTFILVGINEEILVRGYIVHTLARHNNKYIVYILPAIFFSALHLSNPSINSIGLINILIFGILFTYMTLKTADILMAIGFHIAWNFFQGGFFGFSVSGTSLFDPVYPVNIINSNIITGGNFGLEGGILTTIISIIIFLIIYILPVNQEN